jgi:hypothetical protein
MEWKYKILRHDYSFQNYILNLLRDVYDMLGFEEKTNDTQVALLHRVSVLTWACRLGLDDCVNRAVDIFKAYEEDAENKP